MDLLSFSLGISAPDDPLKNIQSQDPSDAGWRHVPNPQAKLKQKSFLSELLERGDLGANTNKLNISHMTLDNPLMPIFSIDWQSFHLVCVLFCWGRGQVGMPFVVSQHCEEMTLKVVPTAWLPEDFPNILWEICSLSQAYTSIQESH